MPPSHATFDAALVQAPEYVVIALRLVGGIIITAQIDCGSDQVSKDLPVLIMCGTKDPVGCMTTTVRALIDRYQHNGVKEVSHIFYDGARHEPLNDFCREQIQVDVLKWLDAHLS